MKKIKRAQADLTGAVISVLSIAILIVVGIIVVASFFTAGDSAIGGTCTVNNTCEANDTYTDVKDNTWLAFTLLAILIVIVVAGAMIGALVMFGR